MRYGIAALIGCLYVAGSVWVVRTEGKAHRADLKERKLATTAETTRTEVATTTPPSEPINPIKPIPKIETVERTVPSPAPPPPLVKQPAAPRPVEIAVHSKPVDPVKPAPPPKPPVVRPPDWVDALDLADLKPEDEARLGQELHDRIMSLYSRAPEDAWLQRVRMTANPLIEKRTRKDIKYTFTILDSDAVNAFSHPGGYIYLSRGLFDLIGEDEDYVLEFVLGHEIAHVDMMHAVKIVQDTKKKAAKDKEAYTLNLFQFPLIFAYPDDQEFEADAWAVRTSRMLNPDRTPRELLTFIQRFQGYADKHKFTNGRSNPDPKTLPFENHFRAHPAAWERLDRLKKLLEPPPNRPK